MTELINGKEASRMPCCGIYALAELSGRSLQFVFNWYKERYDRPDNWQGMWPPERRETWNAILPPFETHLFKDS